MGTVYVFFADGFEEMEALASVDILKRAGLKVQMITVTSGEIVTGAHGVPVLCDKNIENCDFYDAELVLLPGGMPGASTLEQCADLRRLILEFAAAGKPIAAICAAPMILGKLGLLKGKKATCYPGFDQYLEGAEYTGALVEKDGNIITGKGPGAAIEFALAVAGLLAGEEKVKELKEAMCIG
ncbi:DJ-1 family glyoxalase III [uncultured Bacteroides sp.]|uniref:DJ-1 family glyoxalase III n=1 Tax=uncultured Bacteroides sp. TaxID=162156 RepID=UPI0026359E57|nr:DJ-1 family glyoxalase III [uncultured Bacteroides sp.]